MVVKGSSCTGPGCIATDLIYGPVKSQYWGIWYYRPALSNHQLALITAITIMHATESTGDKL